MKAIIYSVFVALVMASSLMASQVWENAKLPGLFRGHLQGIDIDNGKIYWSQTFNLIRTDSKGNIERIIDAEYHHGDICIANGKLYCAVNKGEFNQNPTENKAKNFVYVYDLNLNCLSIIPINNIPEGLGAIEYHNGKFYLGGGCYKEEKTFKIFQFSEDFKFEKCFEIPVGNSLLGVQTLARAHGKFWLGCYTVKGDKYHLWEADDNFNIIKKHKMNGDVGIAEVKQPNATFLIGVADRIDKSKIKINYASHTSRVKLVKLKN